MKKSFRLIIPLLCASLALVGQVNAQEDPATLLFTLVSRVRVDEDLAPYYRAGELDAAAQRHADDMAANDLTSHAGSDGSDPTQRIAEAGYLAWGNGQVIGENFWIGTGTAQDALNWFLDDPPHRENILSDQFREIGIGAATSADGRTFYVLDFGARPNVLPIFINEDAATTESSDIAIRLTNEGVTPQGEGTNVVGQAIEVRISDTPDFQDLPWQPWGSLVEWTLPEEPGEHTVYVQFRDSAGRTMTSADTITLLAGPGTPSPVPPTITPSVASPVPLPSPTSAPSEPLATPAATIPPTVQPTAPSMPSPTAQQDVLSPFPTWTPLPSPSLAGKADGSGVLLGLLCALQALGLLLGGFLALRRSNPKPNDPTTNAE